MAPRKEKAEQRGAEIFGRRALEARDEPSADVRSIVEERFTLMEEAHDRIRTEVLAAPVGERPGS